MRGFGRVHRRAIQLLLTDGDPPQRRAGALAFGVFLGFSPFLGLQVAAGMLLAPLLRLSRVLVFVGLCVNLPWVTVPYYATVTEVAARMLGMPAPSHLATGLSAVVQHSVVSSVFWYELGTLLRPLLLPYAVGSTVGAFLLALGAYWLALGVARAAGRRHTAGGAHSVEDIC